MATITLEPSAVYSKPAAAIHIPSANSQQSFAIEVEEAPLYTINDVLIRQLKAHNTSPLIAYPRSQPVASEATYAHYTAQDIDRFADEAARQYLKDGLPAKEDNGVDEVVAILAPSNLDYVVSLFALSRLGYSLLLLSSRLAAEAYSNLLTKTNCNRIISTAAFSNIVSALQSTTESPLCSFSLIQQNRYDVAVPTGAYFTRKFDGPSASQSIAFIIHSSGSTGLPKPIFQTNTAALRNYSSGLPYRAFLTLPLYHNHGLSCLFRALFSGNEIALFNANLPLTGPNLIASLEELQPGGFHGVPYALKLLAEYERGLQLLSTCEIVQFGGSSCPDDLGDRLTDAGVHVVSHYGATELGQLMTSTRSRDDRAWNYLRPLQACVKYMRFESVAENTYELVILDGMPSKVASNSDDPPRSFRTSDTFAPHPTRADLWKYVGRLDDRITLVNGEKVLPVAIEHQIRTNELVQDCWMFGVGRSIPGLMVVPSQHALGLSKEEILTQVWPSVQTANTGAEGFSQLSKEMIDVLDVGTSYPQTDKGTMIRARVYRDFASEIDAVYYKFENGNGEEKVALDLEPLQQWLLQAFHETMNNEQVQDVDTDLYAAGVDSLQAISILGKIKRGLDIGSGTISQNAVFEKPTIKSLAAYLLALRTGTIVDIVDECTIMAELVAKYSSFDKHIPGELRLSKETIILTGATGTLGAHVLSQLIAKANVAKVYCLVRASTRSAAQDRVLSTLWSKHIPSVQTKKIVCLPSDLSRADLGLDPLILSKLQETLTKVIHCAWAVNFNLGVTSFEAQHIRGTYNLLNICLGVKTLSPAALYFCSSISAAAGTPIPATIEETYIPELSHAQSMGYARSKLVTENIVKAAAAQTGIHARVLRVGQIVGDSQTGLWNSTEAIPLMIRSALAIGALPELDETPNWMPSDLVAKAILDIAKFDESDHVSVVGSPDDIVYHVQNNRSFHWTRDFLPALKDAGLSFRSVRQREWVHLLAASDPDPLRNPTIKLLDFFTKKYDNDNPGRKGLVFLTGKTAQESATILDGYDVIGEGLVTKMVEKWKVEWAEDV